MLDTNLAEYAIAYHAAKQYLEEQGISAKPMPDLIANAASMLEDVRNLVRTLRRTLTSHQPAGKSQLRTTTPLAAAK